MPTHRQRLAARRLRKRRERARQWARDAIVAAHVRDVLLGAVARVRAAKLIGDAAPHFSRLTWVRPPSPFP